MGRSVRSQHQSAKLAIAPRIAPRRTSAHGRPWNEFGLDGVRVDVALMGTRLATAGPS
jgi:hypothetical protein